MNHPTAQIRLSAKVAAVNRANAYALELYPRLSAALAPFVGEKVCKVDGSLLEKVKKAVPMEPGTVARQAWISTGHGYSITAQVKTCESYPPGVSGCCYHEVAVYLGDLQNGVLTKLYPAPEGLRTDYTAETIAALRVAAEKAKEAARQAENACHPFDR